MCVWHTFILCICVQGKLRERILSSWIFTLPIFHLLHHHHYQHFSLSLSLRLTFTFKKTRAFPRVTILRGLEWIRSHISRVCGNGDARSNISVVKKWMEMLQRERKKLLCSSDPNILHENKGSCCIWQGRHCLSFSLYCSLKSFIGPFMPASFVKMQYQRNFILKTCHITF